jgi:hypothetical protein
MLLAAQVAQNQTLSPPRPAPPRDFGVMAWGDSPSDPVQLGLMKEAGLNISGFCRAEDLDRVNDAGLSCFVTDKRVAGYDWEKPRSEDEVQSSVRELARQVGSHPAVLGFYLRDEPSVALMPTLGRVAALLRSALPGTWPYLNLFPTYANSEQLGVGSYEEYVRQFIETVHPPFVSYDNYSLVNGEMLDRFYANLEVIRRASLAAGIPFWNCILANAHFNYMEPSDATFNLQVYSTLAYGGRGIQYFTYFAPSIGNYRSAAIDQFGHRTPTWSMLQRINDQIHALAPTLIQLRSTGVYHYPDVPPQSQPLAQSHLIKDIQMTASGVRPPVQARFLVGEFEDRSGRPYLLFANKDLLHSFNFHIDLKQQGRKLIRISPYSGREEPFGREMDWLAPGAGLLLRVE